jgi:hypothetical protein
VPPVGGKIQIKNDSSHNVFIVFRTTDDTEKMLCVEKGEQIRISHVFSGAYFGDLARPSNYYTALSLYDFDSGLLLKELTVNEGTFKLITGSVDSNSALFEFVINNDSF